VAESLIGASGSASAQAAPALSSCASVWTSCYDEAAGRKKGDARRCGECRVFG
jgi:hypothetical protein